MQPERASICRTAAYAVYCLADLAYLRSACYARVHMVNRLASRQERVRVCKSCKRAPAAFLCEANSASLCAACDAEVHSANPLARRHHRVPIIFPGRDHGCCNEPPLFLTEETVTVDEEEDKEAALWLLVDQGNSSSAEAEDHYMELKGNGGSRLSCRYQLKQHLFLGLDFEPASKVHPCQRHLCGHPSPAAKGNDQPLLGASGQGGSSAHWN
ncbi:hypothetical protein MLD38_001258 [Melastoma candidum]|uniref:Uncharacterized protein n=1 Tax=Melastoma candidum TaxID=119954 RepID=A0ACB9SC05_9MYRT|nr:hypothetical protein MLD38_001258 [Melastoma candidum]